MDEGQDARVVQEKFGPAEYGTYLELDKILDAQHPRSELNEKKAAHTEHLFIITHQAYELWFKQIMHELLSIVELLSNPPVPEGDIIVIVRRMERVVKIMDLLLQQIHILETMTPQDFLEFRSYLHPASGFQSMQFRILETTLGLRKQDRVSYQRKHYTEHLDKEKQAKMEEEESKPSLFTLIEQWLERTPAMIVPESNFNFWESYEDAVKEHFEQDRLYVQSSTHLSEKEKEAQLKQMDADVLSFQRILDPKAHQEMIDQGSRRLSHQATKAALLVFLYRSMPMFSWPCRLLELLIDMDEKLNLWRSMHAAMVSRMIGFKMGTGGSSGARYLRSTTSDRYRTFMDLVSLASYMLPLERLPKLPSIVKEMLDFASPTRCRSPGIE